MSKKICDRCRKDRTKAGNGFRCITCISNQRQSYLCESCYIGLSQRELGKVDEETGILCIHDSDICPQKLKGSDKVDKV